MVAQWHVPHGGPFRPADRRSQCLPASAAPAGGHLAEGEIGCEGGRGRKWRLPPYRCRQGLAAERRAPQMAARRRDREALLEAG